MQFKKAKTAPGSFLPKGTNVTKTEFKVGKIVIAQQTASVNLTDGPVTKKKLGLKELVNKLSHFSQSVRFDSLEGLKELVTGAGGGDLVSENLSLLVTKLAPLTSDRERRVRRTASSLIQAILSQAGEAKLEPLFPVLTAHLSCSLTHIEPAIQQDGLSLIDSLVTATPSFIAANYSRILPDCLAQISARSTDGKKKTGVSTEVAENISAIQWRIDVLQRVDKILEALLAFAAKPMQGEYSRKVKNAVFAENLHCEIYQTIPDQLNISDLTMRRNEDPFLNVIDQVLPLIIDSWVEATAAEGKKQRRSFVSNEMLALLESIAGILDKIINYAQLVDGNLNLLQHFRDKYAADLNFRLLGNLPYSSSAGRCNWANIKLCNVYLSLNPLLEDQCSKVFSCLEDSPNTEPLERLKVLKNLLAESSGLDEENRAVAVDQVLELYKTLPPGSKARQHTIKLLAELAEDEERLGEWVGSLPTHLATASKAGQGKGIVEETLLLETMLKFAQMKNPHLQTSFRLSAVGLEGWSTKLEEEKQQPVKQLLSYIKYHCC